MALALTIFFYFSVGCLYFWDAGISLVVIQYSNMFTACPIFISYNAVR